MRRRSWAAVLWCLLPSACVSLAGLSGGEPGIDSGGGSPDASPPLHPKHDASPAAQDAPHDTFHTPDSRARDTATTPADATESERESGHPDSPMGQSDAADTSVTKHDSGHAPEASTPVWGTLTLVQSYLSTSHTSITLSNPTTAGTLLVAMVPLADAPEGSGWKAATASDQADTVYIWPDNPGGLRTFTVGGSPYYDIIFGEFAGAPSSVVIGAENDTGAKATSITTLSVTGQPPSEVGELELLYLETSSATSFETTNWNAIGTDNDNNFGWWRTGTAATPSGTCSFSPASPAILMLVNVAAD